MNHSKQSIAFREVEVSFVNEESGITLSGTLSLPQEDGKLPAVILFPGSGAVDRDSTFGEYKAFKIIADYLAGKGIAVLRFDKRGVGKSTGEFATVTEGDLVKSLMTGAKGRAEAIGLQNFSYEFDGKDPATTGTQGLASLQQRTYRRLQPATVSRRHFAAEHRGNARRAE